MKIANWEGVYSVCNICHHYDWWLSIYGKVVCNFCHPAASDELVRCRIQNKGDLIKAENIKQAVEE